MNKQSSLAAGTDMRVQAQQRPNLFNKTIETALQRRHNGDALLLFLTDVETGEVEGALWDNAHPDLKAAARVWAIDPLGLIERYEQTNATGITNPPVRDAA